MMTLRTRGFNEGRDIMSPPWMPFYVADYLGDTGHLSTTQHGAYILLICHYWRTGGLPNDDAHLARIAKLSVKNWTEFIKPDLELLFRPNWRHKRIDEELQKYEVIRTKRAIAGKRGGDVTAMSRVIAKAVSLSNRAHNQANAGQMAGKRVATTTTYTNTYSDSVAARETPAVENADRPQEAIDEASQPKDLTQISRIEFDELLKKRRSA
jgi:uncharacterized protein YdaU (DUF1376 family)